MDFTTAVRTVIKDRYADFQGRSRRSEYWWFFLFTMLFGVVVQVVLGAVAATGSGVLTMIVLVILLIAYLALLIPSIAVAIRRMHDTGRSGWFLLLGLIPLIGAIILIYWFVQRGTVGPNEWGNDPYDSTGSVTA